MKYKKALFIFRRDLRIFDNIGLSYAAQKAESIIPCFIFDPRQVGNKNPFRSMNAVQFTIDSLKDLDQQIRAKKGRLYLFYGKADVVIKQIIQKESVDVVICNYDYTPFSIARDADIAKICDKKGVAFEQYHDALLQLPDLVMSKKNSPYVVFSAFYRSAKKIPVMSAQKSPRTKYYNKSIALSESAATLYKKVAKGYNNTDLSVSGGRKRGKKIVQSLDQFKHYAKTKDVPSEPTTLLSAHLKFGTVSVREVYYTIRDKLSSRHELIRQLYWRDFFTYIAYHFPHIFGSPYHKKYKKLRWSKSKTLFNHWCNGTTGFPIVDAGMRQLNQTGWMHNRVRMIVASFLVKDLHINWLWGERYFATQLVDYDPAVNNGNWQWVASTGADAQPYFRVFNPWLQQKKFDPESVYIKRWIPELQELEPRIINNWFKWSGTIESAYPDPIVDHTVESKKAKQLYASVKGDI